MIYVNLKGHDFNYEVFELLRLFLNGEEIKFIEDEALVTDQSFLIESILWNDGYKQSVKAILRRGEDRINTSMIEDVTSIDIKETDKIKLTKLGIKQTIFEVMSAYSERKAPWGVLTGIRPTKIAHDLIDKGFTHDIIRDILLKEYKLNIDKAELILKVAKTEREYIYPLDENKFSLYVSIPFCPTRCLYCSFPSNSLKTCNHSTVEYVEKLIYEIHKVGELLQDKVIDTVYIGGGTPTAISPQSLSSIIKSVYETFGKDNINEFTVEAGRPDTITKEMLLMLKDNDIKRISINPQTMNLKTLKLIGRDHSPDDIIEKYNMAKEVGFNSINMDIIVGLPEEGINEVKHTMEEILKLSPDNLTVHTMAVKKASRLVETIEDHHLAKQKEIEDMLNLVKSYTQKLNMHPYYMYRQKQILGNFENVGYSTIGKECIYNMLIMEEKQTIIAVGAGGISKMFYPKEDRIERVPNVKNLSDYITRTEDMILRKKKYLKSVDI